MQNPVIQWIGAHPWWTAVAFLYFWYRLFWGPSLVRLKDRLLIFLWVMLYDLDKSGRLPKLHRLAARRGLDPGELLDAMLADYEVVIDLVEFPDPRD